MGENRLPPRLMPIHPLPAVVLLHAADNTCVAARNLAAGETIQAGNRGVRLNAAIRLGQKIALEKIPASGGNAGLHGSARED